MLSGAIFKGQHCTTWRGSIPAPGKGPAGHNLVVFTAGFCRRRPVELAIRCGLWHWVADVSRLLGWGKRQEIAQRLTASRRGNYSSQSPVKTLARPDRAMDGGREHLVANEQYAANGAVVQLIRITSRLSLQWARGFWSSDQVLF